MDQGKNKSHLFIGTSGFSYADWVEVFYPRELPKEKWLEHYSQHFNFCELNFSYYRMPVEPQMEKFLEYPLIYAVKGHKSLTHDRLENDQARNDFKRAAAVLQGGGQLGAVLLQFPFSFKYSPENRKYLLQLLEFLTELPLVVEFRNPGWIRDSVFAELERGGWGVSMLDSPAVKGGMPKFQMVAGGRAYLRFHGRNSENWWTGDNISRFDYLYSEKELKTWLPRIKQMAELAKTTYISFNNHARGQAVMNARQLMNLVNLNI